MQKRPAKLKPNSKSRTIKNDLELQLLDLFLILLRTRIPKTYDRNLQYDFEHELNTCINEEIIENQIDEK